MQSVTCSDGVFFSYNLLPVCLIFSCDSFLIFVSLFVFINVGHISFSDTPVNATFVQLWINKCIQYGQYDRDWEKIW